MEDTSITRQPNDNNRFSCPGIEDDKKVFVGGIGKNINEIQLLDYFTQYGDIENLIIKTNPFTGESRGFAFIQFVNSKSVDNLFSVREHTIGDIKVHPKRVTKKVNPLECQIFVGGLTSEITEQDLRNYFVQFGQLSDYQRPFNKMKNQMRNYCFITFEDSEVVNQVLQNPNPVINGKEIDVQKVKFNPERIIGPVGSAIDPATFFMIPAYPGYMALAAASPYATAADYGYAATAYDAYGAYGGDDYSVNGYGGGGNQAQAYRGGQY